MMGKETNIDTPPMYVGFMYATSRTARCPSFHQCEMCHGCTNYCALTYDCTICESRKSVDLICGHTDEQQLTIKTLNEMMHGPIFHPDHDGKEVSIPMEEDNKWEAVQKGLGLKVKDSLKE